MSEIDDLVTKLAQARLRKQELSEIVEHDPYIQAALKEKAAQAALVQELELELKLHVLDSYLKTGNKSPHAATGIRLVTKLEYDINEARVWAQDNLQEAIVLDCKIFEQYAKEQKLRPLAFVKVVQEPQATIKTDLAQYIPTAEEAPF